MNLRIETKFYAAHRNQMLDDKCQNLHGHRYGLAVFLEYHSGGDGGITMLFDNVKWHIDILVSQLDHAVLLDEEDAAIDLLRSSGACGKAVILPFPTSAENLAAWILQELHKSPLPVTAVELRETDTATIRMELEDLASWPTR